MSPVAVALPYGFRPAPTNGMDSGCYARIDLELLCSEADGSMAGSTMGESLWLHKGTHP